MAKAKLTKYSGDWAGLTENPIYQMSASGLPIDTTTWDDALPAGKTAKAISLDTVYTEPVFGGPDFSMDVTIRFLGEFTNKGGTLRGPIKYVKIFKDGELAASIKTDDLIKMPAVFGETNSGIIWDTIALGGFRGNLSANDDWFDASSGHDIIRGRGGNDTIRGWDGNDKLYGDAGNDWLVGYNGNDRLFGGNGDDDLQGLAGNDVIDGGRGNDIFRSEDTLGKDVWTGGGGADRFEIGYYSDGNHGARVTDFRKRAGDTVDLSGDDSFIFNTYSEIRYIGDAAFSGEAWVYEVRMQNGIVEINNDPDIEADFGIKLVGQDSFGLADTSWLILPEGMVFV